MRLLLSGSDPGYRSRDIWNLARSITVLSLVPRPEEEEEEKGPGFISIAHAIFDLYLI